MNRDIERLAWNAIAVIVAAAVLPSFFPGMGVATIPLMLSGAVLLIANLLVDFSAINASKWALADMVGIAVLLFAAF